MDINYKFLNNSYYRLGIRMWPYYSSLSCLVLNQNLNQFLVMVFSYIGGERKKILRNNRNSSSKLVKCQEDSSIPCIFIYEADHFEEHWCISGAVAHGLVHRRVAVVFLPTKIGCMQGHVENTKQENKPGAIDGCSMDFYICYLS